jgi:hypothetical protein
MRSSCKATGALALVLAMVMLAASAAPASGQTQDSSGITPSVTDSIGYSDSLVRPGYRAMLEDTTVGLAGDSTGNSDQVRYSGDTATQTGMGGGIDTAAIPGRRSEDSTAVRK